MAQTGNSDNLAMKHPTWFWIALIYLIATVTYNMWLQGRFLFYFPLERLDTIANLALKMAAIILILWKRGEGFYFLALAFLVGLLGTFWEFYQPGDWPTLPLFIKISRINGFIMSFIIVTYMGLLKKRGVLKSAV